MGRRVGSQRMAEEAKPSRLPPLEEELRGELPRRNRWYADASGGVLDDAQLTALTSWHAVKGWVVRVKKVRDHEGPDYHIWLAWYRGDSLEQTKIVRGYDTYHWAVGSPDHHAWFTHAIVPGRAVTLLVSPTGAITLYGDYEAYIKRGKRFVWAADTGRQR